MYSVQKSLKNLCSFILFYDFIGSWILALAEEVGDKVELIGADISSAMFPSSYPSNVHFVEASVTKLPEEWTNTFDFINQRLLIAALTEPQWRVALSELYRVLKPGGALQLVDFRAHFPFGEGLQKTEELRQMSRALLEKRGQLPDCGNRLPQFALDAGFAEVKENIRNAPIGKSWGRIGEAGSENFRRVLHGFASAAMAEGGLGMYSSEDELHEVVEAASKEWESTDGLFFEFTIVTARKPL